jgi:hypothetical protein
MRDEMKSGQAEIRSTVNAWITDMRDGWKETVSCQVTTAAWLETKEISSEDVEPEVEHREVPMEDAVVKPVKGRKKRHSGQKQAAERCGETKELTRRDRGSQRKVSHCARMAWRKRSAFREIVDRGRNWSQLAGGRHKAQRWHGAGDTIARDTTSTLWYTNLGKDGRLGGDVGSASNATRA